MLNLINFLWKYYAFFLFLILETIALSMLVSSGHQSAVFAYSSNQVGGKAFNSWQSITHYFHLAEANKQLADENAYLRTQLPTSFIARDTVVFDSILVQNDSLQEPKLDSLVPAFDYISAKVISNSIHKQKNYLMLNKGRNQGVKKNMGVISPDGVVGIVYSVSDDFCTVISLLNINTRISSKLLPDLELGTVQWDGQDHQIAQLKSIETYIPIHIGDSIICSGFSHIFPEGIQVGTIANFTTVEGQNTYDINVRLSNSFRSLNYVTIIRNHFYQEQIILEKQQEDAP